MHRPAPPLRARQRQALEQWDAHRSDAHAVQMWTAVCRSPWYSYVLAGLPVCGTAGLRQKEAERRMIEQRRVAEALFASHERAEVTLNSIGNAVLSTD